MADIQDVRRHVEDRYEEFVDALREMVNVDCGSYSPDGVNRIADLCQARFEAGGWTVERREHAPHDAEPRLGDTVIGRIDGTGGRSALLIGHMDTVFPDGTAAERPFRIEDGLARGPGVSDMKGGLLAGFFAATALQAIGADGFGRITYVCNPDEEVGSPFSVSIIQELARDADVCFVLEGARENGDIVSARKGITEMRVEIAGRAAHAGVEPERGRSAILEAANKVTALHALNGRWPGVTVNVGVIEGGTRPNVVPDRCAIEIDIRAEKEETLRQAEEQAGRIAGEHTVPDTSAVVHTLAGHRPMEKTDAAARLVALAQGIASELGFEVRDAATGGASDANTTSAMGVPTIDGLGPIGGDDHSPAEWVDLTSVVPRVSLLAGLIWRAGEAVDAGSR